MKWWREHKRMVKAGILAAILGASIMAATDRELCEVIPYVFGAIFKPPVGWLAW